jgi:hypothetical protein
MKSQEVREDFFQRKEDIANNPHEREQSRAFANLWQNPIDDYDGNALSRSGSIFRSPLIRKISTLPLTRLR